MINRDSFFTFPEGGEAIAIIRIGCAGWLEDELVGQEAGDERECDVDECQTVERAFPRPLSNQQFFPIHFRQDKTSWSPGQSTKKATVRKPSLCRVKIGPPKLAVLGVGQLLFVFEDLVDEAVGHRFFG